MRIPRYGLRTLLALVTLVALFLGCFFGGWARPLFIGVSLRSDEWEVHQETVATEQGGWARRITCYAIDPAAFRVEVRDKDGGLQRVVLAGDGTGMLGLRTLRIRVAVADRTMEIREDATDKIVLRCPVDAARDWPNRKLAPRTSRGSRGMAESIEPGATVEVATAGGMR
jgi:hypothetical protein